MTKMFPLMVLALIATLAAPLAVDYVGGLTLDLAAKTTAQMGEALK